MINWEPVCKELGAHLAKCRRKNGMTQTDVAKNSGEFTPQFISNIERGGIIPLYVLSQLAVIYDLNPKTLSKKISKLFEKELLRELSE